MKNMNSFLFKFFNGSDLETKLEVIIYIKLNKLISHLKCEKKEKG